jgi:hypothetical protein
MAFDEPEAITVLCGASSDAYCVKFGISSKVFGKGVLRIPCGWCGDILIESIERSAVLITKPGLKGQVKEKSKMSLNDLEFAYAPVRNQVRDLREYL